MNGYTLWIEKHNANNTASKLWSVEVVEDGLVIGKGEGGTKRLAIVEALEDAGVL